MWCWMLEINSELVLDQRGGLDHEIRDELCKHILAVGVLRAKRRGAPARRLAAFEDRIRHELLDDEER